ncbi:transposase [Lysinibacillus endophyticus]|uniref:Transposase n=1 Tax=Ureibacillus endophyticus TaxID=1978490 RepID=A0A494YR23_9BACL|nr:helix-turn-helix domain-containing protein [Lysinibacillus endophyticus]MCP1144592.1 transposase [Lysinibacillus endophyticus]MCP1145680.1 transposase [Lysinibacillus endophyticus]MCP1146309.1 transposase [Lysinibacillus endophyticus]MCP1146521.1 transposase [Lysinibacillus endophyticus]RKQ11306.1 transposase [Lysinibacillus endophyticus]
MSRKNNTYSNDFKLQVVLSYLNSEDSYVTTAKKFNLRSKTQVERWVQKYKEVGSIEAFNRLPSSGSGAKGVKNPLKGKRVHFNSVEEERDYYKAQVEYLKKQYPNL